MSIVYGYLTVKEDPTLLKAIAAETVSTLDDKDLTESFLNQMSTQYRPDHVRKTNTVVEVAGDEGQNFIADDTHKDKPLPSNT